jgi:hypothetical protein
VNLQRERGCEEEEEGNAKKQHNTTQHNTTTPSLLQGFENSIF